MVGGIARFFNFNFPLVAFRILLMVKLGLYFYNVSKLLYDEERDRTHVQKNRYSNLTNCPDPHLQN